MHQNHNTHVRSHSHTQDHTPFYIFHMSDFPWSTGTHGLDQGVAGGERGNDSDIPTAFSKLRRVFDVVLVPSVLLGADALCLARVASLRGVPRTMVVLELGGGVVDALRRPSHGLPVSPHR